MTTTDYGSLQAAAEADGRQCAVGALVLDDAGRVFVHRRGWDRSFLPGCWDIIGGHVEPGELLLDALRREVAEETGWTVAGVPQLIHVGDWELGSVPHREFDFLVDIRARDEPRLEFPQHVEFRWLGPHDVDLLAENRDLDDGLIRRLVELALRSARREPAYPHTTLFLDVTIAAPVESLRAVWDPAMASQSPAHVSVTYPIEIDSIDALGERVAAAADTVAPFRLRLGRIRHCGRPEDGIYVEVDDVDGGWRSLRTAALAGTESVEVEPHVTLLHPRTTNRGSSAWAELAGTSLEGEMTAKEAAITAFDGRTWPVLSRFPLSGQSPR